MHFTRRIRFAFLLVGLALPMMHAVSIPLQVTVLGDRVNLRAQSNLTSEVVGQVNYGDTLTALAVYVDWVRVDPPGGLGFWVHADFLHEGREVKVRTLNVRAGPGTNYSVVGQVTRGELVEVLEEFQDWRRIRPPEGSGVWISREFVQLPVAPAPTPIPVPTPVPTATPRPTPAPIPTPNVIVQVQTVERVVEVPVAPPAPTPTVVPPADLSLVPLQGQGSLSVRRGVVKAYLLAGSRPSRFQLILPDGFGRDRTVCYLRGDDDLLKTYSGKAVQVRGRDFWVAGEELPVTKVEEIQLQVPASAP